MSDHAVEARSDVGQLSERLAACYTGVLHDVMRAEGLENFTLPPNLRAIDPKTLLAGPAFTVLGRAGAIDPHQSLLAWTGMLSRAPAGHVLVIKPNDGEAAFMGELSAETLKYKGLRGALVEGGCRDSDLIRKLGFPVWASHYTPIDIVGRWTPASFDAPVTIGAVTIHPGDFVCGDCDGVVRIPVARAEEITALAEAAIAKENLVRKAILQGIDPQEAYIKYGKF